MTSFGTYESLLVFDYFFLSYLSKRYDYVNLYLKTESVPTVSLLRPSSW
jgi:hypothetical protein